MVLTTRALAWNSAALDEAGLPRDEALVCAGDFSESSGVEGMRTLLERCPDLDGLFAANDLMAIGAVRALHEAGRTVPGDVAGFDDSPLARVTSPALSTVRQPTEEMGRRMAAMLLNLIPDGADGDGAGQRVLLDTELVVRDSS